MSLLETCFLGGLKVVNIQQHPEFRCWMDTAQERHWDTGRANLR